MALKTRRTRTQFKETKSEAEKTYGVKAESMTVSDKLKVLEQLGQPGLIDVFKDWEPKRYRRRKVSAPLDQRVAITVTDAERASLEMEMKAIRDSGSAISYSQFIRNRAMGTVDINGWAEIAEAALKEFGELQQGEPEMKSRRKAIILSLEETDDPEEISLYESELVDIKRKMDRLIARVERRGNRLTGRMSMVEAETVKWRAQRLCLPTSDYLRMLLFGLTPDSHADQHLSLASRQRFYVSILDVVENGWGNPPNTYACSQCATYVEQIDQLQERIRQLESFL